MNSKAGDLYSPLKNDLIKERRIYGRGLIYSGKTKGIDVAGETGYKFIYIHTSLIERVSKLMNIK